MISFGLGVGSPTLYGNYDIGCLAEDHVGSGAFGAGLFEHCCICEKASGPEMMWKVVALYLCGRPL